MQFLPSESRPAPDVLRMTELFTHSLRYTDRHLGVSHGLTTENRQTLDERLTEVIDDLLFKLIVIWEPVIKFLGGGRETSLAVEHAAGDV